MASVGAIAFDFNGTLSNDEPILCEIYRALFEERGRPLSELEYYEGSAESVADDPPGAFGDPRFSWRAAKRFHPLICDKVGARESCSA